MALLLQAMANPEKVVPSLVLSGEVPAALVVVGVVGSVGVVVVVVTLLYSTVVVYKLVVTCWNKWEDSTS